MQYNKIRAKTIEKFKKIVPPRPSLKIKGGIKPIFSNDIEESP
jgi:hypothetical protein